MATLKGIFPNPKPTRRKNFIHENVKNLRRMEEFFHSKEVEDLQKLQLQKKTIDKYQNVGSKIDSSLKNGKNGAVPRLRKECLTMSDTRLEKDDRRAERKISDPTAGFANPTVDEKCHKKCPGKKSYPTKSKKDEKCSQARGREIKKTCSNPNLSKQEPAAETSHPDDNNCTKYRNQGIQTLDIDNMETLYRDAIIRYPSSRCSKNDTSPLRNIDVSAERDSPPADRGDVSPTTPRRNSLRRSNSPPVVGDHVERNKLNAQKATVASRMAAQLNHGVPPASYRKGVVPKYIRDRKEAQQQRDEKIKAAASHPDCPTGHVSLPDVERKETLRMLKKHYQEYVNELNMMPIKTDTLRSQRRKMEIEKQLNHLEEGIKVFSRPKVYVKINA